MTKKYRLPDVDWLSAASTKVVIDSLQNDGTEVRFIGGCVRNSLARKPVTDIDIATPDRPERVIELLSLAGIKSVTTGLQHGTVKAIVGKSSFDITTLRQDAETYGRHAKVVFCDNWLEDAKRRDFTINSISASPSGTIFDPFGGVSDLENGCVKFIGKASERITEDYLRILRFFRFHGLFGRGPINEEAMTACRAHATKLQHLSNERIGTEFLKILLVPEPDKICVQMRNANVLKSVLTQNCNIRHLRMVSWLETEFVDMERIAPDDIRHLAALIGREHNHASHTAKRLCLSRKQREQLVTLAKPENQLSVNLSQNLKLQKIRRHGNERAIDLVLLAWAGELAQSKRASIKGKDDYIRLLRQCIDWTPPTFPISGTDVLNLGVQPGTAVGTILADVEAWWESEGYNPKRTSCLRQLELTVKKFDTLNKGSEIKLGIRYH